MGKNLLDDCDRPACDDMVSKMQQAAAAAASASTATTSTTSNRPSTRKIDACPPGSSVIGKGTWNLLHSMAAWLPENPNEDDQKNIINFMETLAKFYPCTYCAKDFQTNIEEKPVQVQSRAEFCQWLCEQHNLVNTKLGKQVFPCDMKTLDQRWRKSDKKECIGKGLNH